MNIEYQKGRGAQINTRNRFLSKEYVKDHIDGIDEDRDRTGDVFNFVSMGDIYRTSVHVFDKSIVEKLNSLQFEKQSKPDLFK